MSLHCCIATCGCREIPCPRVRKVCMNIGCHNRGKPGCHQRICNHQICIQSMEYCCNTRKCLDCSKRMSLTEPEWKIRCIDCYYKWRASLCHIRYPHWV
jgi:hypothetical protein